MTADTTIALMTAGLVAGLVDSMGGGGGLISVPAFLAAGVPPHFLLGTNKAMAGTGATVAAIRYARAGFMPKYSRRDWMILVVLCAFASILGAAISMLPAVIDHIKAWLPFVLVGVMAFLGKRWVLDEAHRKLKKLAKPDRHPHPPRWPERAALACIAGYDGLFGPGTGAFFLTYLERHGYGTVTANALTKVLNLSSNVGALLGFAISGRILWGPAALAATTFMLGNFIGSGIVIKKGQIWVRVFVLFSTTLLLVKYLRS